MDRFDYLSRLEKWLSRMADDFYLIQLLTPGGIRKQIVVNHGPDPKGRMPNDKIFCEVVSDNFPAFGEIDPQRQGKTMNEYIDFENKRITFTYGIESLVIQGIDNLIVHTWLLEQQKMEEDEQIAEYKYPEVEGTNCLASPIPGGSGVGNRT